MRVGPAKSRAKETCFLSSKLKVPSPFAATAETVKSRIAEVTQLASCPAASLDRHGEGCTVMSAPARLLRAAFCYTMGQNLPVGLPREPEVEVGSLALCETRYRLGRKAVNALLAPELAKNASAFGSRDSNLL